MATRLAIYLHNFDEQGFFAFELEYEFFMELVYG